MKPLAILFALLTHVFVISSVSAQDRPWAPDAIPSYDFDKVVVAKVYQDKSGADVLGVISFETGTEMETVDVPVTRLRMETRTREVKLESGDTVEQSYQVSVPYTEFVTQSRPKILRRRIEVPFRATSLFRIDGRPLSLDEAKRVLGQPKRCFLRPSSEQRDQFFSNQFFAQMFQEDVLVIWYDENKAQQVTSSDK